MMNRNEAIELIREKVPNENLCRHMIAVGAIMKTISERFDCDPLLWEITGILHDIDLGVTNDPDQHGRTGSEWLKDRGMPKEMTDAILAHAGHADCRSDLEILLMAGDQLSGLITACALVMGKNLANVTTKSVKKRFKEPRFAAGANREAIEMCEKSGIFLDDFIADGLRAMQAVASELGL